MSILQHNKLQLENVDTSLLSKVYNADMWGLNHSILKDIYNKEVEIYHEKCNGLYDPNGQNVEFVKDYVWTTTLLKTVSKYIKWLEYV